MDPAEPVQSAAPAEPAAPVESAADPSQPAAGAHRRRSRLPLVLTLAALCLLIDQVAKSLAVANLDPANPPRLLGGLVYLSLLRNPGAAWSIGGDTGMTWIFAVVAVIVAVVIVRVAAKLTSTLWAVSLGLILGGAMGNLADRLFRSPGPFRGHVVDFLSVFGPNGEHFPVFNTADCFITVGAVLLVLTALLGIDFDGTRGEKQPAAKDSADE